MSEQQHNWSRKSLDELVKYYTEHIHQEFLDDSTHIDQPYPTAAWLREHGYSGIRYTLRERQNEDLLRDRSVTAVAAASVCGLPV